VKKRVVVVDDENSMSAVLAQMVRVLGHEARVFRSPAQCLAWMCENPADLGLFDIRMGQTNGLDLLRQVREQGLELPIVFVTGDPQGELAQQAWKRGALGILGKPVSIDLMQRVFELAWGSEDEGALADQTEAPEVRPLATASEPAAARTGCRAHEEEDDWVPSARRLPAGALDPGVGDGWFAGARSLQEQLARLRHEVRQQEGLV
jgi:DNA-binding NtrC family response regulator